jgi:SAM-dependent methyltransferase
MAINRWSPLAKVYTLLRTNPISGIILRREITGLRSLLGPIINRSFGIVGDLGTGRGHSLPLLPQKVKIKIALDNCPEMVELSRKQIQDVRFIVGDACYLPLKQNQFDLLLCVGVLEYIHEMESLIDQCHRILRKGGYLIITNSPYNIITYLRFLLGPKIYPRDLITIEHLLNNKGFNIINKILLPSQQQILLKKG